MGDKVSNHVNMIGLMCRGLMVKVGGNGEGAQVILSLAEVSDHVGPGPIGRRKPFPGTKILL